jgi:cardiolipin synthase
MGVFAFLLSHHIASMVGTVLALTLATSVVRQRRPTGSAIAWLLAIVLLPYLGIPLYLVFGGRKFRRRARDKAALDVGDLRITDAQGTDAAGMLGRASSLEYLGDGTLAYRAVLAEILRARRSIRIETFLIGDDETGRTLLDALAQRAREGIEVQLLLDDLLRFRAPRRHLTRLATAGGRIKRFMPLVHVPFRARSNLRNHRKIAIFDGERALVGGMNLADEYMGPLPSASRWRDVSVMLVGPCVSALDTIFRADWQFAAGEELATVRPADESDFQSDFRPVQVVPSGPDEPNDAIYDALLQAVYSAKRRIWLATPYFAPDESLIRGLEAAARRHVDVRAIVPERSNHRLADFVGASMLRDLADVGVGVFRYQPSMLHAKALLVDDSLAAIGSANFDMRSLFLDYEVALLFSGQAEVAWLDSWFVATLAASAPGVHRASWLTSRVEPWARLLAPLV